MARRKKKAAAGKKAAAKRAPRKKKAAPKRAPRQGARGRDAEGLTPREARFVDLYLADPQMNGSRAYVNAGYQAKTPKVASAGAARLLARVSIEGAVARLRAKLAEKMEVTREKLVQRLLDIADLDLGQLLTETGSLRPVSAWPEALRRSVQGLEMVELRGDDEGTLCKIRLGDRGANLERIARLLGFVVEKSRSDTSHVDAAEVADKLKDSYTAEELMAVLDRLLGRDVRGGGS